MKTQRNTSEDKKSTGGQQSLQMKIQVIGWTIVYALCFFLGGIFFCYFKLIFSNVGTSNSFRMEDFYKEFAPDYPQASVSSWTFFPISLPANSKLKEDLAKSGLTPNEQKQVLENVPKQGLAPGETVTVDLTQTTNPPSLLDENQPSPETPATSQTGGKKLSTMSVDDSENRTIPSMFVRPYVARVNQPNESPEEKQFRLEQEKEEAKTLYCKQLIINVRQALKLYFANLCNTGGNYFNKIYLDVAMIMMYLFYQLSKFLNMFYESLVLCGVGWGAFTFFILILCPLLVGIFTLISLFRHSLLYGAIFLFTGIFYFLFPFFYLLMLFQTIRLLLPSSQTGKQNTQLTMFQVNLTSVEETLENPVVLDDTKILSYSFTAFLKDFIMTNQTFSLLLVLFFLYMAFTQISFLFGAVMSIMFLLFYFFVAKQNLSMFTKKDLLKFYWSTFLEQILVDNE